MCPSFPPLSPLLFICSRTYTNLLTMMIALYYYYPHPHHHHHFRLNYLHDIAGALKTTLRTIRQQDTAHPLTILGIPATWSLYTALLTSMGSVFVTLLSAYTRGVNSESSGADGN
jgi:hypothetical protein